MSRWASPVLGPSATEFLAAIHSQIPVALIATPRAEFKCQSKDRWQEIERDLALADFDQVPLTKANHDSIEAVFVRGTGVVDLGESMFIASDFPLISFLETADQQRFRFLVADSHIAGMVTLSDLQKLPVYSVLFSLVLGVEMLLMEWIRKTCGTNEALWLEHLDGGQRGNIEKNWKDAVNKNLGIDRLSCASFGQEIRVAVGLGLFREGDDRHASMKELETLRHKICHGAEFALNPEQALNIPRQVREAQHGATWLHEQIGKLSK